MITPRQLVVSRPPLRSAPGTGTTPDRPGRPQKDPPICRPARSALGGLHTGRATVADAWRCLHNNPEPRARTWLDIPDQVPRTPHWRIASSRRLYRAPDATTTAPDSVRHNRRSRLPQRHADFHVTLWNTPKAVPPPIASSTWHNRLVLAVVRMAQHRGHLRGWKGDVSIDATGPAAASHPTPRTT